MDIIQFILSTLVSTGIIAVFITHHYDKKLKSHELKLEKYIELSEMFAKVLAKQEDFIELGVLLNGALLYSSENVVREILIFNEVFTHAKNTTNPQTQIFQISSSQIQPLIEAIRAELDLGSKVFKEKKLKFFHKTLSV